jgi:hypothetical protein
MTHRQRSLRNEYEIYVEQEIENYKDSIPRSTLLSIGDEAVASLERQAQFALTEMVLWDEVDRIITRRLRLPSYRTWRARRERLIEQYRRPEHWGINPDDALVREVCPSSEGHVLVAGAVEEGTALYLAANGLAVTAMHQAGDVVDRVLAAAEAAGLSVRGCVSGLGRWAPDVQLSAVVVNREAFAGLSAEDRDRAITLLQGATRDGGVHLLETILAGAAALSLEELRSRYVGWSISIEHRAGAEDTFLARKAAS